MLLARGAYWWISLSWGGTQRFAWGKTPSVFPDSRWWRVGPLNVWVTDPAFPDKEALRERHEYARKWLAAVDRAKASKMRKMPRWRQLWCQWR